MVLMQLKDSFELSVKSKIFPPKSNSPADEPKNRSLCDRSVKIGI